MQDPPTVCTAPAPQLYANKRLCAQILRQIKQLTGVVEVGLFCGMAQAAYFGNEDGSVGIRWEDGRVECMRGV